MAAGTGRARCPGHHLLRRPRCGTPGRGRRRRPLRAARVEADRLPGGRSRPRRAAASATVDLVVDVQNGLPFFTRAATRAPGRRARAPRAPRAVAGRLPRASIGTGRVVRSSTASRRGSTGRASTSRCPAPPATSCVRAGRRPRRIAVVHNGTDPVVPTGVGKSHAPHDRRRRPPGPAQAGRARHRRRARAARAAPRTCTLHVVGGGWWEAELHRYAAERGAGRHGRLRGPRGRAAQARGLRAGVGAGPAVAEGGVGPRRRRGRHAPHADRRVRVRGRDPRVDRRTGVSGLLVDGPRQTSPTRSTACWSTTPSRRDAAGGGAYEMSHQFTWEHAQESFAHVRRRGAAGRAGRRPGPGRRSEPRSGPCRSGRSRHSTVAP